MARKTGLQIAGFLAIGLGMIGGPCRRVRLSLRLARNSRCAQRRTHRPFTGIVQANTGPRRWRRAIFP